MNKLKTIKKLTCNCLNTLRPVDNKNRIHSAEIKVSDYYELSSVIRNLMKLCIVALDQDTDEVPTTVKNSRLILGLFLELPCSYFQLMNSNC